VNEKKRLVGPDGKKAKVSKGNRVDKRKEVAGEETVQSYSPPAIANPGNVIRCKVGGGLMGGDAWCSQNEAPFPEYLAEFMIRSFCKPGGTILDCFLGSGTTAAVAHRWGRNFVGCDLRQSQVTLALSRLDSETPMALFRDDAQTDGTI
jgi:DNA modification methylase